MNGHADLLPCPFCGGIDTRLRPEDFGRWHEVICNDCGPVGGLSGEHEHEAIVAWNRRSPQQPEALAQQERDREDAERWRAFIGLDYKVRMEWACNLSMVPVLIEWVDQLRAARSSEGGAA